jgi:hypothetical protein
VKWQAIRAAVFIDQAPAMMATFFFFFGDGLIATDLTVSFIVDSSVGSSPWPRALGDASGRQRAFARHLLLRVQRRNFPPDQEEASRRTAVRHAKDLSTKDVDVGSIPSSCQTLPG